MHERHEFDWNDVHILDNEPSWFKRIISEMIHIKIQFCGLNKQSDTCVIGFLHTNYTSP